MISYNLFVCEKILTENQTDLRSFINILDEFKIESFPLHTKISLVYMIESEEPIPNGTEIKLCFRPPYINADFPQRIIQLEDHHNRMGGTLVISQKIFKEPGDYKFELYLKKPSLKSWPRKPNAFWYVSVVELKKKPKRSQKKAKRST